MTETTDPVDNFRCGFVALVGRPNVGKSSLLNKLIGQKISIVSRKPQTTRHRLLGIHHRPDAQIVYVDTPGLHAKTPREMNRYLNRTATDAMADVDVVVLVVEGLRWTSDDDLALQRVENTGAPVVLAVNKVDLIDDKSRLLPHMEMLASKRNFAAIIPVSAQKGVNLKELESAAVRCLPQSPPLFPEEQITDRSERFLVAELVREQLMSALGQELPYAATVEIESYKEEGNLTRISAVIWVERQGQKAIVIGQGGHVLKRVGQGARIQMERLLDRKVFLQLWVKVREGWSDDLKALRSLGYD